MGVRPRELDANMHSGGAHVTNAGASVLGQRAGLWAHLLLDGWVEPAGSHSPREPNTVHDVKEETGKEPVSHNPFLG